MSNQRPAILQTDPKANYLAHKAEIDAAIAHTLDSGWYILGQEVTAFEREFATYIGVSHAVGVANGTDAIEIALRACSIGPGDAVFTVSHTAVATVAAIELVGATPILVDIDATTYTMEPNQLEDAIKTINEETFVAGIRPKAILPVHLYGHPADLPALSEIARRYELYLIEDCSQAHGAAVAGQKIGTWGDIATFSFYPTKNLGALGDGGSIATNNEELAQRCRWLREYGWQERYISNITGMNSRLDELQAAILRVKLKYLDLENQSRQRLANLYNSLLASTPLNLPQTKQNANHVFHQYVVRSQDRDGLREYLKDHFVSTAIHYPMPVHRQPAYRDRLIRVNNGLATTEQICCGILSLPMYPHLLETAIEQVSNLIVDWQYQTTR